MLCFSTSPTPT